MLDIMTFCMALNVYFEARGEPLAGQYAVAHVTMNRVRARAFPNDVCSVVMKRKHFSWTTDRMEPVYRAGRKIGYKLRKGMEPDDMDSWRRAVEVAKTVMNGRMIDITGGALFYHTRISKPWWKPGRQYVVATIGNHVFYRHDKSQVIYNR
jgi:N-acetylmuramoyl-L-alanine amidase